MYNLSIGVLLSTAVDCDIRTHVSTNPMSVASYHLGVYYVVAF